jgi:hypothetical protein
MKTPLLDIRIMSCYTDRSGARVLLPSRMAKCTPDTRRALAALSTDLAAAQGALILSDLYRSYDMQLQAHLDYTSHKKKAYSPPPGGSMHEAGRAFDLDIKALGITLARFWELAASHGVKPIINTPDPGLSEAWHFDCRGSHGVVYDYYAAGKASNMKPYEAMAVSAILSTGVNVDRFAGREKEAALQAGLIRLGFELGNIDGLPGSRTFAALQQAGIASASIDTMLAEVENLLQAAFPLEYSATIDDELCGPVPGHVIA